MLMHFDSLNPLKNSKMVVVIWL